MAIHRNRSNAQLFTAVCFITLLLILWRADQNACTSYAPKRSPSRPILAVQTQEGSNRANAWASLEEHYPVKKFKTLPKGRVKKLGRVQHFFKPEHPDNKAAREQRRVAVRKTFKKCWASYRERAFGKDELGPLSGDSKETFGGWAATLIDSLDTLWIMNMRDEFKQAVDKAMEIDFVLPKGDEINVFETTIRYLGGFLSAYDLSADKRLLSKAVEVGEMLYKAFDTPNRMPITRWKPQEALNGDRQEAHDAVLVAEIGSLAMEFTRLSQLTGNMKWYDAVEKITQEFARQQPHTKLPGLWPVVVDGKSANFTIDNGFTLSAMADSFYEYFPKTYALLGGRDPTYRKLYDTSMQQAIRHLIFRPMLPEDPDVLFSGNARVEDGKVTLTPEGQHLGCFTGGMFALAGRLFSEPSHVEIGRGLTDGCIWAYEHSPHGIMPERFTLAACADKRDCTWSEETYMLQIAKHAVEDKNHPERSIPVIFEEDRLPLGMTAIYDRRYILRPEAIESVFVMWRVTGEQRYQDAAWQMFEAISKATETEFANAALEDVTSKEAPKQVDSMESFWFAETLKYFYLTFSDPKIMDLDKWVFNTEAHPFRRPV